ncbi:MAG TPA: 4-hydroxy-tetrahydrodipicolinate reductase [Spirochaetota bacterium]|nr:4-hydroxy-tetrahydrodipicolinate reductase [Spirochaetota bacterium]HPI89017.1 4-hydroxy-tetrahydrodipicolinate reductase [Spirochaetota bacterium]
MNIGVCGICGRMGHEVLSVLMNRGHSLCAGFDAPSSAGYGKQAGSLILRDDITAVIGDISPQAIAECDGIIDFSAPAATMKLLEYAVTERRPLVIGTTGLENVQVSAIEKAAEKIPVLFSPNMSIGVNVLFKLTEIASSVLSSEYDVEIFEAHHRHKKDAPSGTAKKLIDIVKKNKDGLAAAREVWGRDGITGERTDDEVGIFAMRGGDIVGDHTVYFIGNGERIELTHRATNRNILASGAVLGMEYLIGKNPGLYTMFDVLGFK